MNDLGFAEKSTWDVFEDNRSGRGQITWRPITSNFDVKVSPNAGQG